jgi:hypothetical protein
MIHDLSTVLLRDLDCLAREIELYPDDDSVWEALPGAPNSGGTLALHLAGNLRHFIGAILGGTGYVRDRDAEFSTRGLPRTEIVALIRAAQEEVKGALERLDPATLEAPYPLELAGRRISTRLFLLQLAVHLTFHLGQVDYHRRASTSSTGAAGAVSLQALGTPG